MNKYIELSKQKVLINVNNIIRIAVKDRDNIILETNRNELFLKVTDNPNKLYDKIKIFLGDPNTNLMSIE